ncbi:MAG: hypothetical protein E7366_02255 [Clostridiales bacterium]|nr:hypothetical protein [Clostridiales bacterium]
MRNIAKKIYILALSCLMPFSVCVGLHLLNVTAEANTVYVSASGSDENDGTNSAPYASFQYALEQVPNGGTIVLQDTVSVGDWTTHGKAVTVTGGSLDATAFTSFQIRDHVTFTDVALLVNAGEYICANGYSVVMGEGVTLSNAVDIYGGGTPDTTVAGTNLTLLSGTYRYVYGGSLMGTVNGDTHLTIGGAVNADIDVSNHSGVNFFFGGGCSDTITGNTYLSFGGNAKATHLFGGSLGAESTIGGTANLTVTGGASMSMYGASKDVDTGCDVKLMVTGGSFEQVFGGSWGASLTGDVDVRVLGGTISRRIYGGCYNDINDDNIFNLSFASQYYVNGRVNLTLGSKANITYSYSDGIVTADKGVYARSRYNKDVEDTQLVFADETAYNNYKNRTLKLTAQDSTMKGLMGSLSVADETHYYTYSVEGNVVTQHCAYHDTHSATAIISMENSGLQYTGAEITPVCIDYSNDWEYDKFDVAYKDNVEVGTANYTLTAGCFTTTQTFEIRNAPVVLGGSVRLSTPAGLRFQSKVDDAFVEDGASFGTLIMPKDVLGDEVLTIESQSVLNIPQTKWATDSVKEKNPQDYEEGFAYFNAVLTEIPAEHYDKVIVARSYAYLNGAYYYSEPIERSIAQVAAYALQDGYTDSVLYSYVDEALADETLAMESVIELKEGRFYQLNLTGTKGYVAVWKSSDERIVVVDSNGKVQARRAGTATITVRIGNKYAECIVTVKENWSGSY